MNLMQRRHFLRAAAAGLVTLAAPAMSRAQSGQGGALRMTVHPYNSTLALVATHRPLVQYLEKALQQPIEFYTAPTFDAYLSSLLQGEHDIVITPPHFGVLAIEKKTYLPLVNYRARLEPFFVVPKASPIEKAGDFAGRRIAMADKAAFIRIVMLKQLADAGLAPGRDFTVVERPTHAASLMAALHGEADAGLAMGTIFKLQPEEVRRQLRPVMTGHSYPNLFTLAHRRLGTTLTARLLQALSAFPADPEGKAFFDKTGYGGYDEITAAELDVLKPFVQMTRALLPAAS